MASIPGYFIGAMALLGATGGWFVIIFVTAFTALLLTSWIHGLSEAGIGPINGVT